jgi:hypothetical protein
MEEQIMPDKPENSAFKLLSSSATASSALRSTALN